MIDSKYLWNIEEAEEEKATQLAEQLKISLPLAKLLWKRKITTQGQFDKFFHPEKYQTYDPFLFAEMDLAVARIKQAIELNEQILVYGDYDADGVTSIAVLMKTLQHLGANAEFYIPNRFTEGYGPNIAAFDLAKNQGVDLIITVDNGIAALEVMTHAKEIGLDVIVTDHHEPREVMPEAVAVIHPKHPKSAYPFDELAGVGVAYKLSHALLGEEPTELLDLVAVGTVADLVSLTDENRMLVQLGLRQLREGANIGLAILAKKASLKLEEATEETIGFGLAPRLNAVGRLGPADPAADLLLTEDPEEALFLAEEIDDANKERKQMVVDTTKLAMEAIEAKNSLGKVLVVSGEGWNTGILGIVASKLVSVYSRPAIVLGIDAATGIAKGSGRSIESFHLYQALDKHRELMTAFGGHPMAAGLTLPAENLLELEAKLQEEASQLVEEDFRPALQIEERINLADASVAFIAQLEKLAPFGMDNPKPIFLLEGMKLKGTKRIGADKTHLKTMLGTGGTDTTLDAIGFGVGDLVEKISPSADVDVVGELSINEWNNIKKPQLRMMDVRIAHWQLFDVRSKTEWSRIRQEKADSRIYICFEERTAKTLGEQNHFLVDEKADFKVDIQTEELVFADIPPNLKLIEEIVREVKPARIFVHFDAAEGNQIPAIPDRKAFAELYSLIKKFQPFPIEKYTPRLMQKFGWNKEQIEFMSNVFFDLEFAKMESGQIIVNQVVGKRNLDESLVYQQKVEEITTRKKLLYSNYSELHSWMKSMMETSIYPNAEELENGN
ncbi:single-stranded-DNA-specific exonuclease RecJ [Listeria ivanovii]|uniref:Single-stranded-DNA-specific exonuclease RecJ n=1 Tax=Listeria ivanovii (strain ATCC BAA-678 / PAM 55) TaxID=881621 RepID=G2Z9M4_LISIP|nr:single-stranded-DNA-specific exonuclease RecJ [Listeria ivanovii]MCJ1717410.1 single-stranded-DNA-specific exonuclease RecJ [Listeria ivanovii]MCJ1722828.1 single-stranded-DNA-specific exonuclease RecJ [Listeria ivanovii]MCJ1735508.1 single-stranded-DNA-specific exonuclease RecJ [Listeria ivanovii]CBW85964.1 Putative single-stranded-DNA-specific exonuclease (RecJ) [Listeria ivanovii subsp. ivanovii PAM 55]